MRYRKQDQNGDYVFGHSGADFYVNSPDLVAQAIRTRLRLWAGEYFLNTSVGMPWQLSVLGYNTSEVYDGAIRDCISKTPGFLNWVSYTSSLDHPTRVLSIRASVNTVYSGISVIIAENLSLLGGSNGNTGTALLSAANRGSYHRAKWNKLTVSQRHPEQF